MTAATSLACLPKNDRAYGCKKVRLLVGHNMPWRVNCETGEVWDWRLDNAPAGSYSSLRFCEQKRSSRPGTPTLPNQAGKINILRINGEMKSVEVDSRFSQLRVLLVESPILTRFVHARPDTSALQYIILSDCPRLASIDFSTLPRKSLRYLDLSFTAQLRVDHFESVSEMRALKSFFLHGTPKRAFNVFLLPASIETLTLPTLGPGDLLELADRVYDGKLSLLYVEEAGCKCNSSDANSCYRDLECMFCEAVDGKVFFDNTPFNAKLYKVTEYLFRGVTVYNPVAGYFDRMKKCLPELKQLRRT